jgi:hypothetical protein
MKALAVGLYLHASTVAELTYTWLHIICLLLGLSPVKVLCPDHHLDIQYSVAGRDPACHVGALSSWARAAVAPSLSMWVYGPACTEPTVMSSSIPSVGLLSTDLCTPAGAGW